MVRNNERVASYFLPEINGKSPLKQSTCAPQPMTEIAGKCQVQKNAELCSNKSGRGIRCKRFAQEGYKRCEKCLASGRRSVLRNFLTRMVVHSRTKDRQKGFKWDPEEYVDRNWMEKIFMKRYGRSCYWCGKVMNRRKRTGSDGLQLERLNNSLPHLKSNCVFACGHCNRRSWRPKWDKVPHHCTLFPGALDDRLEHCVKVNQDRVILDLLRRQSNRSGSTA